VEPKDFKLYIHVLLSKGKGVIRVDVGQGSREKDVDEFQYERDKDRSDD